MNQKRCIIFGATGKLGKQLLVSLDKNKYKLVAIGRSLEQLKDISCEKHFLDFHQTKPCLPFSFTEKDIIINAAHACYTQKILDVCQLKYSKFILVGSTRKYSKINALEDDSVRKAEQLVQKIKKPYIILHPSMIYGAAGENNVQRIAKIGKFFHFFPFPWGGKARIQPIYIDDVALSIVQAVNNNSLKSVTINLGGPSPMTYKNFLKEIFLAAKIKVFIFPVPEKLLYVAASLSRFFQKLPSIQENEIKRLYEDKTVDIRPMKKKLGLVPRSFSKGLSQMFDNLNR